MTTLNRKLAEQLTEIIDRDKSVLLLGPRQTGKTTLIKTFEPDLSITFIQPRVRLRYEKDPNILIDEVSAIETDDRLAFVIIDEVQKVPEIMDAVQYLIDERIAKFILTGSSARKLKRDGDINLLPGRVILVHLDALMLGEIPPAKLMIEDLLTYGSLPEILLLDEARLKEELLEAYVITYLEEEVRAEAIVRSLANFARFLELAATEAGYVVNVNQLSQKIGVATATIESYYQILEDCLIVERVDAYTESKARHRLSKSHKYLFYDLGVRRVAAREGIKPPQKYLGHLFEQFVGIELIRQSRLQSQRTRLCHWRDLNGPEVDWLIEQPDRLIPIEVKLTDAPTVHDARHLKLFLSENEKAQVGYIICRTPNSMKIRENIIALPWQRLAECLD